MINLSPERQAELLAEYKQKKAVLDQENTLLTKLHAEHKQREIEFYKPRIVTTDLEHKCVGCNCTILKGSRAVVKAKIINVSGSGWTGAFITEYLCAVCGKILSKVEL